MNATTIIIAVLAAAAAIFAVLFFQDRKDAQKYESKADSLTRELSDLRCELTRKENDGGDSMTPLTRENIVEFLKREKTGEVEVCEDAPIVTFNVNGERYHIDCSRLPQQFILRKGYGGMEDAGIHWDILEQAAVETSKALVMVKMHVINNDGYDFMIVSTTHTVAGLREDYGFFMSLIADAERKVREEYWKIMEIVHPEECVDEQAGEQLNAEDMAVRMAQMTGEQKKIQS